MWHVAPNPIFYKEILWFYEKKYEKWVPRRTPFLDPKMDPKMGPGAAQKWVQFWTSFWTNFGVAFGPILGVPGGARLAREASGGTYESELRLQEAKKTRFKKVVFA